MIRKPCKHGVRLEKGLRCDHGFIQVLIQASSRTVCKNFGLHTKDSQLVASIFLAEKRKEVLNGMIGIEPELPKKRFDDVSEAWYQVWSNEKSPEGLKIHSKESCYKVQWTLNKVLKPVFGKHLFDAINSVDVEKWRVKLMSGGLSGGAANRYQSILSSIFSHTMKWVETEKIKPGFKLPVKNPCTAVEMSPAGKRKRIPTDYELKKLKNAFFQLNDTEGWEICKLALKSVLSMKDLRALEIGQEINIERSKTGVAVNLPITNLVKLNWFGWRTRWEKARDLAKLSWLQFRDLRKKGINMLKGRHNIKLVSEYAGHADVKTTEGSYTIPQIEQLAPLARDIEEQVESI